MIIFDRTNGDNLIGLQRSNKDYTYLSLSQNRFKLSSYYTFIQEALPNIDGIGPTILVEWKE